VLRLLGAGQGGLEQVGAAVDYTNNHNVIELAVFRHNIDTTFTLGRPGMVYYM